MYLNTTTTLHDHITTTPHCSTPASVAMSSAADTPAQDAAAQDSLATAQVDGSGPAGNGSTLREPEREVEVKLADLQADPNNPLFSVKSFEELQLCVAI